jgi:hypothetical protein
VGVQRAGWTSHGNENGGGEIGVERVSEAPGMAVGTKDGPGVGMIPSHTLQEMSYLCGRSSISPVYGRY